MKNRPQYCDTIGGGQVDGGYLPPSSVKKIN